MKGIYIRLSQPAGKTTSLLLTDIDVGEGGRRMGSRPSGYPRSGPVYIPTTGYVDLVYSSTVALSYESGAIAKFVALGLRVVQFKIGDAVWDSLKTRMGWADYNNAGPVQVVPANTWTTLTNDTLGPQTQTAYLPATYNAGAPTDLTGQDALVAWLRMGDGDRYPILADKTGNGHIGTMTNMTALNLVNGMVPAP